MGRTNARYCLTGPPGLKWSQHSGFLEVTWLCCGCCAVQVHPAADYVVDEDRYEHLHRCIDELFSRFLAPPPDLIEAQRVAASLVTGQLGRQFGHDPLVYSGTTFSAF